MTSGGSGDTRVTDPVESEPAEAASDDADLAYDTDDPDTQPIAVRAAGAEPDSADDPDTQPIPVAAHRSSSAVEGHHPDDIAAALPDSEPRPDSAGLSSGSGLPWWNEPFPAKPRPTRRRPATYIAAACAAVLAAVESARGYCWHPTTISTPTTTAQPHRSSTSRCRRAEPPAEPLAPQYPAGACAPAPPTGAAIAMVICKTADHVSPASASYVLTRDEPAMRATFDDIVHHLTLQVCPGRIQSPGPWRRNATPQQISGTLLCGAQAGQPTMAWTTDTDLLVSTIHADAAGPTLDQLYAWWSAHS